MKVSLPYVLGTEAPSSLVVAPLEGSHLSGGKEVNSTSSTSSSVPSTAHTIAHNINTNTNSTSVSTSTNTTISQAPISIGVSLNQANKKKIGRKKQPGVPGK
jgi:hypothetical protein